MDRENLFYTEHENDIDEDAEKTGETGCKRYIYILLLRYPDTFSRVFRTFSRTRYSHASIGISESDYTFYSYVTKGFRTEFPQKHPTFKHKEVPCRLYRIEISDEKYNKAKSILDEHVKQSINFKYNMLGVLLCLLRIGMTRKNRYFCSQFVCEMLEQIKAVPLAKRSALYMPDDFTKMQGLDLWFSGHLSELVSKFTPAFMPT